MKANVQSFWRLSNHALTEHIDVSYVHAPNNKLDNKNDKILIYKYIFVSLSSVQQKAQLIVKYYYQRFWCDLMYNFLIVNKL